MATSTSQSPSTAELFDDLAEVFDDFSKVLDTVERPLGQWMATNLPPGRRALDVGCGAGRYSVLLAKHYDEVVAVDPAPGMIEIAERDRPLANVTYQVRDAYDVTPELDGQFDVVFGFSAVFHMGQPGVILPHLSSLLAPGGRLVVFDPDRPENYGSDNWQVDYAFTLARMAYDMTGNIDVPISILRAFTHKSWLMLSERTVPMSRAEFRREYSTALPGVRFEEQVFPGFITALWTKPAA